MELFCSILSKRTSTFILFIFISMNYMSVVNAALVTTAELIVVNETQQSRHDISIILQRESVQNELVTMGVDPEMVYARIDSMSDKEINELAGSLSNQKAGGNPLAILGIVLLAAGLFVWYVIANLEIGSGF